MFYWQRIFWVMLMMPLQSVAQKVMGVVKDQDGKAMAGVSVFINTTSIGTSTDKNGMFMIGMPGSNAELIFTFSGYINKQIQISKDQIDKPLEIVMLQDVRMLDPVIVRSAMKDGWEKWGKFFVENFIGVTAEAANCKIENPKALRFYFNQQKNELTIAASEPLIIQNNGLGYRIQFSLEEFVYSGRTHITSYSGYPFFIEMNGSERKKRKWSDARQNVFKGSVMHFMRALYRNELDKENFLVQPTKVEYNLEKKRVRAIYRNGNRVKDSSAYYSHILSQPDSFYVAGSAVKAESIAFAANETTGGISFEGPYQITYKGKKAEPEIATFMNDPQKVCSSFIRIINTDAIYIFEDGSQFPGNNLLTERYWAYTEKICRLLPFNYKIPRNK